MEARGGGGEGGGPVLGEVVAVVGVGNLAGPEGGQARAGPRGGPPDGRAANRVLPGCKAHVQQPRPGRARVRAEARRDRQEGAFDGVRQGRVPVGPEGLGVDWQARGQRVQLFMHPRRVLHPVQHAARPGQTRVKHGFCAQSNLGRGAIWWAV